MTGKIGLKSKIGLLRIHDTSRTKYHTFKIIVSDFNNNKVYASGVILNKEVPIIKTIHNNYSITFDNILEGEYQYEFHITGKNDLDKIFPANNTTIENNIINWEITNKPFSVLKIDIRSNDGTKYLPQYIQIIKDDIPEYEGNFNF